jgi:hypothetical protein
VNQGVSQGCGVRGISGAAAMVRASGVDGRTGGADRVGCVLVDFRFKCLLFTIMDV